MSETEKWKVNQRLEGTVYSAAGLSQDSSIHSPSHLHYSVRNKIIPARNTLQCYTKEVAAF